MQGHMRCDFICLPAPLTHCDTDTSPQRKRVTICEMYLGARSALFLDEISTGLDSATLFRIISVIRRLAR